MRTKPNYGWLDRFRIIAALAVIAIHTSPLATFHEGADFFLTRVLARIAVPFFFMVTGHFVVAGFLPSGKAAPSTKSMVRFRKFLAKTSMLYLFCIILYLPVGIYAGHYKDMSVGIMLRMLFFDGTFYHLWYFPACIMGVALVYLLSRFLSLGAMTAVSAVLYAIGLLGDSYYGLVEKVPALEAFYGFLFQISSYTRNGLFLAPLFLVLGAWMAGAAQGQGGRDLSEKRLFLCSLFALSFALMTGEAFLLRHFQFQRHDSMYLLLVPVMLFLYRFLLCIPVKSDRAFRTASTWIYVLHPAFIVVVRGIAKPLGLTGLLVDNSLVHYLAVSFLSVAAAFAKAVEVAFQAVRKPVEGTILTVLRDAAAAAKNAADEELDTEAALDAIVAEAYASVQRTPDLLPVLKEHGVVDAGGFGLATPIYADAMDAAVAR